MGSSFFSGSWSGHPHCLVSSPVWDCWSSARFCHAWEEWIWSFRSKQQALDEKLPNWKDGRCTYGDSRGQPSHRLGMGGFFYWNGTPFPFRFWVWRKEDSSARTPGDKLCLGSSWWFLCWVPIEERVNIELTGSWMGFLLSAKFPAVIRVDKLILASTVPVSIWDQVGLCEQVVGHDAESAFSRLGHRLFEGNPFSLLFFQKVVGAHMSRFSLKKLPH